MHQIAETQAGAEFALDHLPGAVNLPVLDDEERARIGRALQANVRAGFDLERVADRWEEIYASVQGRRRPGGD